MPRPDPGYRLHSSGLAYVQIKGRRYYLGKYDTPESKEKYHRTLAELHSGKEPEIAAEPPEADEFTIADLLLEFWQHREEEDGPDNLHLANFRPLVRGLLHLYGSTLAADFGPNELRVYRKMLVDRSDQLRDPPLCKLHGPCFLHAPDGVFSVYRCPKCDYQRRVKRRLARTHINATINRLRQIFKFGVEAELVPATVLLTLQAVAPLRAGKGKNPARETSPVRPVLDEHVEGTKPFVSPPVRAMIELQRLTGIRSDNVTSLRLCDIDMSGEVWVYEPAKHKTKHHGKRLQIAFGPKAKAIIYEASGFLTADPKAYLFSPREANAWRRAQQRKNRKTKLTPSQAQRRAKNNPKRAARDRYDTRSYAHAVRYGIRQARKAGNDVPHWHPHQLRHTLETEVRRRYGLEAAQVAAGHSNAKVTEIYAERDFELARKVAREMG